MLLLAVTGPGVILLAARSYLEIDRDLTAAALSRRQSIAYLAATTLTEKLDRLVDVGVALATRVRFSELVAAGRWIEAIEIMAEVPADFPAVTRVFLTDSAGTEMADVPALPDVRGRNFAHRDWYRGVSREWRPYVSEVYTRAAQPQINVVAVAVPISDASGRARGVLVLQVALNAIVEWVAGIEIGEEGIVYVVDRNGRVASHPDVPQEQAPTDFSAVPAVQRVLAGAAGVNVLFDPTVGENRLAAYAPIPRHGWGVVAQQSPAAAFAARDALLRQLLVGYGLILLFIAGVVYLVARLISGRERERAFRRSTAALEARVAERTAELEAANEELEAFSYTVSHDLRAPLRAVQGFAQALLEDYAGELDAQGQDYARRLAGAATRMDTLIQDLLAYSQLSRTELQRTPVRVREALDDAAEQLEHRIRESRATVNVDDQLPTVLGHHRTLVQVLQNLVANALTFVEEGVTPVVRVRAEYGNGQARIWVEDNGIGIAAEHRDRIFSVFERLHGLEAYPGTGIGLAIVRKGVERMGGRAGVESQPGHGSQFWIELPLAGETT